MAISAEVQKVLDDVAANKSVSASVDAGVKLLQQQIADLQTQIANSSMSADDKTALGAAATDLESTTESLKSDIPANTTTP